MMDVPSQKEKEKGSSLTGGAVRRSKSMMIRIVCKKPKADVNKSDSHGSARAGDARRLSVSDLDGHDNLTATVSPSNSISSMDHLRSPTEVPHEEEAFTDGHVSSSGSSTSLCRTDTLRHSRRIGKFTPDLSGQEMQATQKTWGSTIKRGPGSLRLAGEMSIEQIEAMRQNSLRQKVREKQQTSQSLVPTLTSGRSRALAGDSANKDDESSRFDRCRTMSTLSKDDCRARSSALRKHRSVKVRSRKDLPLKLRRSEGDSKDEMDSPVLQEERTLPSLKTPDASANEDE